MNWCKPHWDQLRQTVKEYGLDKFGAKNQQEAASALADQLQGKEERFDPLLGCWSRINAAMAESLSKQGRAAELLALRCPCCILVEDGQPKTVKNWLDGCVSDALKYAIEQRIVKEH